MVCVRLSAGVRLWAGIWVDMNELDIARGMLLRIGRGAPSDGALARGLLEWAGPNAEWLLGRTIAEGETLGWEGLMAAAAGKPAQPEAIPHALVLVDALAELLGFDGFERMLLRLLVAASRLSRLAGLAQLASRHGRDLPALLGEMAGADPADAAGAVRRSSVMRLGLLSFQNNAHMGHTEIAVRWTLDRLFDREPADGEAMIDALVGPRQPAVLTLDDFAGVADADFLVRLLQGALRDRAAGVNILIHGPPGTGKTEFARTLAAAAGAALHAVGEVDDEGEEPNRWDRVGALRLAQRLLGTRGGTVLLFDEMEDLIGDARPSTGDWMARREGSKVFINRLIETNAVPVIWTTNAIGNVDNAILRRMSFVLKLDMPSVRSGRRMLARIATEEGVVPGAGFDRLLARAPEAATVFRVAARSARLADESDGGLRSAEALVRALRGGELPHADDEPLDLDLFEADLPIGPLVERLADAGGGDVSLLLTGVPGTGKTALAHHLARALDRPLLVKRASDLLSPWIGGTEAAIAGAFGEARGRGGVLLFDEVDSLLFDRGTARASWEVSQINEMLSWLDRHKLPVVAATNHAWKLDPAVLRRFVFKLELRPLGSERAARAFERFFGVAPPVSIAGLDRLTPGDFAVVARQLRHAPAANAGEIVDRLRKELAAKPEASGRLGF